MSMTREQARKLVCDAGIGSNNYGLEPTIPTEVEFVEALVALGLLRLKEPQAPLEVIADVEHRAFEVVCNTEGSKLFLGPTQAERILSALTNAGFKIVRA